MKDALRRNVQEFSGSLGDLGTFLPLAVSLIAVCGLDAAPVFFSAGLFYVAASLSFRLPMPVQPLKATSAVAIAIGAAPQEIAATALFMGAIFISIAVFRLDRPLKALFPRPVVRGIQLGLGILLVKGGWNLLGKDLWTPSFEAAGLTIPAGAIVAAVTAVLLLLSARDRRFPSALAAVLLGVLCGLWWAAPGTLSSLSAGFSLPGFSIPSSADLDTVLFTLLLPQIPLTFANSIVATAATCRTCFGKSAEKVTERRLSASLGAANLFSGLAGGLPMCHGSGGVTAHYRFGARTGRAGLFIGSILLLLGAFFGNSISSLCSLVPAAVLGMFLLYVGIEHGRLIRDILHLPRETGVAVSIGLITLATGNLSIAFGAGIALEFGLRTLWPAPGEEELHVQGNC
ncbi:MAG: hypothetical protein HY896_10340 [Deltaproteobacteria bacterium]|nr:hypothetical protein [Deltaproteobacteria bacterium]